MTELNQQRIKEAYLDMLNQACGCWENEPIHPKPGGISPGSLYASTFKGYDSKYLSTYEHALDLAVELGWIERKSVIR